MFGRYGFVIIFWWWYYILFIIKNVSLQHILHARSAQMLELIQNSVPIIQPTLTMFNSKLLRLACSSNKNVMNKIQIEYEYLQNDYKKMQPLYYPIAFWGHLVIGLFKVIGHSSRRWFCETLPTLQSNTAIF